MAPRKKRKSFGKISSVKCAPSVIQKQNKRKNYKKTKRIKKDSIQEIIMNETFVPSSDVEENNSKESKIKPVHDVEIVGDQNILSANFIPFSARPLQNCDRKGSDEDETRTVTEISEVSVTIVDDNDAESICVDSDDSSDSESGSVNDSIQIVGEKGISQPCRKCSDQGRPWRPKSTKINVPLSAAKKRKMDDSIEILETVDSVSDHGRKKARIDKNMQNPSVSLSIISNSDDETPRNNDQDDDIVIVETIDNNSKNSIQVVNDFIPLKMSSAIARERARRKKTFEKRSPTWNFAQNEEKNSSMTQSLVFQDTIGIAPGSSHYKSPLKTNTNQDSDTNITYHNVYGNNVYNPNSVQKTGLRPVIIDGSNVAFGHGGKHFSTRGIEICVDYFVKRGHWVVAFVPLFRRSEVSDTERKILDDLRKKNQLAFTPSRYLHGRRVASYDDRFIVQCAAELGGIVVSTDNYRDLVCENEAWRETIEKRLLMFTWVGDLLMFPDDPNGRIGPRLEEFLRFPQ